MGDLACTHWGNSNPHLDAVIMWGEIFKLPSRPLTLREKDGSSVECKKFSFYKSN